MEILWLFGVIAYHSVIELSPVFLPVVWPVILLATLYEIGVRTGIIEE